MLNKLKKIKPGILGAHLVIALAYPVFRAFRAENNKLLAFTDALTIISLVLPYAGHSPYRI